MAFLIQGLQIAMGLPKIGQVIVFVLGIFPSLGALSTAGVMVWHGVVALLTAASKLPACGKLAALAAKLQADETKVDDFEQNKILPFINRLSAIALPQKPAAN